MNLMIDHVVKSAIQIGRVIYYSFRICIKSVISYVKFALSSITIGNAEKCLVYEK